MDTSTVISMLNSTTGNSTTPTTTDFITNTPTDVNVTASSPPPPPPLESNNGAIAGGVIGGILGIVLILLLIYCWRRKRLSSETTGTPAVKTNDEPHQRTVETSIPDASPGYDRVVPVDRSRYSNSEAFYSVNIDPNNTDNAEDADAIYVNDPSYVNLDQTRTSLDLRASHYGNGASYYDNLPGISRTPSARKEEEEDEYVAMDNLNF